ncbi:hypothetical protein MKZ38_008246 [Zalerion maritima]|uniref:Uncharacterized protein n=1 Tax=Zalerion maritima TaxID=339359 RepID=A0AAD5RUD5_9PEZI|nr:hypothetical protein MKZ38_008246 [Zalerion maritima]
MALKGGKWGMTGIRPTAIILVLFPAAAFSLAFVPVVAGTKPDRGGDFCLMALNTSRVGTEAITFTLVDSDVADGNGIDGGIGDFLDSRMDRLTDSLDDELVDLEEKLVSGVVDALGIKDEYKLILRDIARIPEHYQLYPILRDGRNYEHLGSYPCLPKQRFNLHPGPHERCKTSVFAFIMTRIIASGLVFVLSLVGFIIKPRFLVGVALGLAATAMGGLLVAAVIASVINGFLVSMENGLGEDLTLYANSGTMFIQFVYIS